MEEKDQKMLPSYFLCKNSILCKTEKLSLIFWRSGQTYIGNLNSKCLIQGSGIYFFPFCGFLIGHFENGLVKGFAILKEPNANFSFVEFENGLMHGKRHHYLIDTHTSFLEIYEKGVLIEKKQLFNSLLDQNLYIDLYDKAQNLTNTIFSDLEKNSEISLICQKNYTFFGKMSEKKANGLGIKLNQSQEIEVGFFENDVLSDFGRKILKNGDITMTGFYSDQSWVQKIEFIKSKKSMFFVSKTLNKRKMVKSSQPPACFSSFVFDLEKLCERKIKTYQKLDIELEENSFFFPRSMVTLLRNSFKNYQNYFQSDQIYEKNYCFCQKYFSPLILDRFFLVQVGKNSCIDKKSSKISSFINNEKKVKSHKRSTRSVFKNNGKKSLNFGDFYSQTNISNLRKKSVNFNSVIFDFGIKKGRSEIKKNSTFLHDFQSKVTFQQNVVREYKRSSDFNQVSLRNIVSKNQSPVKINKNSKKGLKMKDFMINFSFLPKNEKNQQNKIKENFFMKKQTEKSNINNNANKITKRELLFDKEDSRLMSSLNFSKLKKISSAFYKTNFNEKGFETSSRKKSESLAFQPFETCINNTNNDNPSEISNESFFQKECILDLNNSNLKIIWSLKKQEKKEHCERTNISTILSNNHSFRQNCLKSEKSEVDQSFKIMKNIEKVHDFVEVEKDHEKLK